MEDFTFYIINLDRSKERWEDMKAHYDNDKIVRVEGYDGNIIDDYKDIKYAEYNHRSKDRYGGKWKYELGCCFSHIKAIKMAYEAGLEEVFIVEDDIYNTYKNKWRFTLREIITNKPRHAECLTFFNTGINLTREHLEHHHFFFKWRPVYNNIHKDAVTGYGHNSTGIYYLTRKGMKKIYDKYIKNNVIDLTGSKYILIADKLLLYPIINTYHITKPMFIDRCKDSCIDPTTLPVSNNLLLKHYYDSLPYYNKYK